MVDKEIPSGSRDILTQSLAGKVAIVTGASSGIGRAAAIAFAKAGAKVVLAARRIAECDRVVEAIARFGGEATSVQTDVTIPASIVQMCRFTQQAYGRLDIAFNNAGIAGEPGKKTADQSIESWDAVQSTNLRGVWLCMKEEIPLLSSSGGGVIVNTASDVGIVGSSIGIAPYVASKHGVIGLTKSAALEYARENIRVNAICPGITRTEMMEPALRTAADLMAAYVDAHVPNGRIADPQEIADIVVWLCSPGAAFITGQAVVADGGFTAA